MKFRLIGFKSKVILIISMLFCFSIITFAQKIPVQGKRGMVATGHFLATEIGLEVLKKGGNAIDASVATAFALAVVLPEAGNIGGGGFMVYRKADGFTTSIDFREKAPLAATATMFLDSDGKLIPKSNSEGLLSVAVPGTVSGLYLAHKKYGKLPWAILIEPAIKLALEGFPVTQHLYLKSVEQSEAWQKYPTTAKTLLKGGTDVYEIGELWKQPDLAETLKIIAANGDEGFYKGVVAKKFAKFMAENGGIITEKDLANYTAVERKTLEGTYRGYTIHSMPPVSSGGVLVIQMLNMLEKYDLKKLNYRSANYYHIMAEAMRRAHADRAEFLGDPDYNPDMPVNKLISKEYAISLTKTIQPDKASKSDSAKFGQIYRESENTTHFSIIDEAGNAVSVTYTLHSAFGSKVIAGGLGFFLNNLMADFNPVPGYTDTKGLIGTKPNLIEPGKRMLSTQTPTIVSKDGKTVLIIGSPGGITIANTVMQVIVNFIDNKMDIAEAIDAPRIYHRWLPDRIESELHATGPETRNALRNKGHTVIELNRNYGQAVGISVDHEKAWYYGAVDMRWSNDASAKGF